jgi:hypothetical protein
MSCRILRAHPIDRPGILRTGRLDVPYVVVLLSEYLGPDDRRIRELVAIRDEIAGGTES